MGDMGGSRGLENSNRPIPEDEFKVIKGGHIVPNRRPQIIAYIVKMPNGVLVTTSLHANYQVEVHEIKGAK